MAELTLLDLVRNHTMSPAIAGTLAAAAEERRSLLFIAIPRMAGKTTTMTATLAHARSGMECFALSENAGPSLGIPPEPATGYLIMSEIATTPFPDYLWGEPVRRVFRALRADRFSLATALHAGSLEEAFEIITAGNAVPDEDAARIDLAVYIRSLGDDWRHPTRRVIAEVHEIDAVTDGRPQARLLHRWQEAEDRFALGEPAQRIGLGGRLDEHAEAFARQAGLA